MSNRQISSASTFFNKWGFLLIWLGIGSSILVGLFQKGIATPGVSAYTPYLILAGGTAVWWFTCFDLADSVVDMGDYLQIRRGFKTDQVQFANIVGARYSNSTTPGRLTLDLELPSLFGSKIAFLPIYVGQGGLFSTNLLADELLRRANASRSKRSA